MRAIYADALIKKAYDEAKGMAEPYDDFGVLVEWLVDKLPTIEPERKTGIWKSRSLNILYPEWERYECSACGGYSYIHKFCPNCGAKMEEGDRDA